MERHRFALLITAWAGYIVLTVVGWPVFGISVMLPGIPLCGLAAWLYGYKTGLLNLLLSIPYNMLAMIYNLGSLQEWCSALDPVGITVQLGAVLFIAKIKDNHSKSIELTANLAARIEQRREELQEISECLIARSNAERSRMSETLCNIVAYQQSGLFYHSKALMKFLVYSDAPQADAAIKLVQVARQNMEQVKSITRRLSSQKIVTAGIEQTLHEMCAYFRETAAIDFTLSIRDELGELPEEIFSNIYRIAHEVISNATRYEKTTHIDLVLKLTEKTGTLKIVSNGTPTQSTPDEGLGMRRIRQRADIINAMLRFGHTAEGQPRFECIIPLHDPSVHCSGIKY
jgi:signal transduction histidine kinase